jgi:hypothetical protein
MNLNKKINYKDLNLLKDYNFGIRCVFIQDC